MKTITIAVNDRPEYLQQVLASIKEAKGSERWTICLSLEPCEEIRALIDRLKIQAVVSCNMFKKGCDGNTFASAELAFSFGSEFNLYLEDDVVISKDALVMAEAFRKRSADEPSVLCLRRWHEAQDLSKPVIITNAPGMGLLGNGFAYSMRWYRQFIRPWWFYWSPTLPGFGWDWSLSHGLDTTGVRQYRPLVNRSQNIGLNGTTTAGGTDQNHFGPCYDGLVDEFKFE